MIVTLRNSMKIFLFKCSLLPKYLPILLYDFGRIYKYSGLFNPHTEKSLLARITRYYHILEKELAMPERTLGFGKEILWGLIEYLEEFSTKYPQTAPELSIAVSVLKNYRDIHLVNNYSLDKEILEKIEKFITQTKTADLDQPVITADEYWSALQSPFPEFSASRHCIREYNGNISQEQIINAVRIANNAPSACNRQPWHVHFVSDYNVIQQCLAIQGGNRGFGHFTNKLLVLTSDMMSSIRLYERQSSYIDAGIYLMNLSYSLHYSKVAHCILHWSQSPATDKKLRKILTVPDNENIVAMFSCGALPEKCIRVNSPRKAAHETIVIH